MKTIERQKQYTTYDLVEVGQCFFPCKRDEIVGYMENISTPLMKIDLDDLSVELKTGSVTKIDDKLMCLIASYSLVED